MRKALFAVAAGALMSACSGEDASDSKKTAQAEVVLRTTQHHEMDSWRDIAFADDTTGYAVGMNQMFYKTTDGGASWSLMPVPAALAAAPNLPQDIRSIHFASPELGFASGAKGNQGYIAKSTDKGATWTIKTPFMTEHPQVIRFNGSLGLAAGSNSLLMRSTDAGETWTKVTGLPSSVESFERIAMEDPSKIYVSSPTGIFFSSDQGVTWTPAPNPNPNPTTAATYLGNLRMQSTTVGYAHNTSGLIKTTDGATTWTQLWKVGPGEMFDGAGYMLPERDVLCFTHKNDFYVSRNGGASFETFALPAPPTTSMSIAGGSIWGNYAVNRGYVYVFPIKSTNSRDKAIYRIKYK